MKLFSNIRALKDAYKTGLVNPKDYLTETLKLIRQDEHNAWISVISDDMLEEYLSGLSKKDSSHPLWGVPFAVKDNIDLKGLLTTAACREFSYAPDKSAFAVQKLIDAGAIPMGKTNLDQFATGLVGVRSPYGACHNSINGEYVSGGSSSGSAVAVADFQVMFSLGTDTAGSGRVPAAFNNILGLKGTCGAVSCSGVVPACRSLDCLTVFARCTDDLNEVFSVISHYDPSDIYSRKCADKVRAFGQKFTFGVPMPEDLEFFGDSEASMLFYAAAEKLKKIGGTAKSISLKPFLQAARLLYEGSFVSERLAGNFEFFQSSIDKCLPVIKTIIGNSKNLSAYQAHQDNYRLKALKLQAYEQMAGVDFVLTPTTGTIYKIEEVENDPIALNSNLGYYTNFMNLLDFCAIALPAGIRDKGDKKGLPFGITLFAKAFCDEALLDIGARYTNLCAYKTGALMADFVPNEHMAQSDSDYMNIVVCGAHLEGLALNYQLSELDALLVKKCRTAPSYRMYRLNGSGSIVKPGMVRVQEHGTAFDVEVYRLKKTAAGSFLSQIPYPLGLGRVELEDGTFETGFICEGCAVHGCEDISEYGSFREYLKNTVN